MPDVVIVLGEELGRFRDTSKGLYKFLEAFTWSGKVERLGFDEVFMDVTDSKSKCSIYTSDFGTFDILGSVFQVSKHQNKHGLSSNLTNL